MGAPDSTEGPESNPSIDAHHQMRTDLESLTLIWGGVLICNFVSKKYRRLSPLVLHLLLGCLLVNLGLLPETPSQFINTLSELAITIVMFSLGLEEDVRNFIAGIKQGDSERRERALWKTRILAMKCVKRLQTKWLHPLLN